MTKSMTSFGRAVSEEGSQKIFSIEMKSVNHRYLDISIRMPKSMIALEEKIRKQISSKLSRGKVDVFINYKNYGEAESEILLNKELAKSYFKCLEEISRILNIENDATPTKIARFSDVITVATKEENLDAIYTEIKLLVDKSIDSMIEMRIAEGEKLKNDILNKLSIIEKYVEDIEKIADMVPKQYKAKLQERIKELTDNTEVDESRIAVEVAILADKATVDEEIIRLRSHLYQMRETFLIKEPIGRKLDFIVQEMNRETNTIASKSNDIKMTNITIEVKNIIEKIREQVQNIE